MNDIIYKSNLFSGRDARITSAYGSRIHPVTGETSYHAGVDLVAADGDGLSEIYAPETGTVIDYMDGVKGYSDTYAKGNYVRLLHSSGRETLYAHLSEVYIQKGIIHFGEPLGRMGATGRVTGAHLHFQMYDVDGTTIIDPTRFAANQFINALDAPKPFQTLHRTHRGELSPDVVNLQAALASLSEDYLEALRSSSFARGAWDGVHGSGTDAVLQKLADDLKTRYGEPVDVIDFLNESKLSLLSKIGDIRATAHI